MKIAILTLGSRGDVQPYVALGSALKARGHQVVVSTARNFEEFVKERGLDFAPVDADFEAMMNSEEVRRMRKNPLRTRKLMREIVDPMLKNSMEVFFGLAMQNDKVLFHVKTLAGHFADRFPGKMISADVVPAWQATSEFPNPILAGFRLPGFLNKWTYKATDWGMKLWSGPIREFRVKAGLPATFQRPMLPSLYGISEHFLKRPTDYPSNSMFSGFWFQDSEEELSPDLLDFLGKGAPPLLITFGSMPFEGVMDPATLVRAIVNELGVRVILVRGWGLVDMPDLGESNNVKVIQGAPFGKLLPFVRAVVHHGGIGTMAACLRAGKPVFVCPVLHPVGDQYFWGSIAHKKGVGPAPIPLKKASLRDLLVNIRQLVTSEEFQNKATYIGSLLANEDGIGNAIRFIEEN